MNPAAQAHLDRLRTATDPALAAQTTAEWLLKNTVIKGKAFSFKDHEYQKVILDDPASVKFCKKCSQIGISELAVRRKIAITQVHTAVNCMYVLPTATFASTFSSTRLATALEGCKTAKDSLYRTDSATVKRFMNESYIYMKGASKSGQAISVPVDFLTIDEKDFAESQDILTAFTSRMTHSDFADELHFSTPTVGGYGISYDFDNSKQFIELQRCNHCNHEFHADYYAHVALPGFNVPDVSRGPAAASSLTVDRQRNLREINFMTKELLTAFDVSKAYLECPACRRACDQNIRYRRFVCVNPESNFEAHGYQVTPFAAPKHMPPSKMIVTSTKYKALKDFVNNTLGLSHDDETTGLSESELSGLFRSDIRYPDNPPYQILGGDLGGTCATLTGYPAPDGHLRVMTARRIPLHRYKLDLLGLLAQQRIITSVLDSMPYTDMVSELQTLSPHSWACLFTETKGMELYQIRAVESDEDKASYGVRQISAKRDALLDFVVTSIRAGKISFAPSTFEERDAIIAHLRDLKRIQITDKNGETKFTWRKSTAGVDHYFFALAFLLLADFIKGLAGGLAPLPMLAGKCPLKKDI